MMSLRGVSNRKLFYSSSYNSRVGTFQPKYLIYHDMHKSYDRNLNRRSPFLGYHSGFRLFSISPNKLNFLSRLTSYFTKNKLKEDDTSQKIPVIHAGESLQEKTQNKETSRSQIPQPKPVSLINMLPVLSPYNLSTPVSSVLQKQPSTESNVQKLQHIQNEISESAQTFLQQYNKDLDLILKKATPSSNRTPKKKLPTNITINNNYTDKAKHVFYPRIKQNTLTAVKTPRYEETREFLQSLNIPCDELEFYPNIQKMEKKEILTCIEKLKELGIHVVFCLFLIDHISLELYPTAELKPPKYPVTSYVEVQDYMELCHLLDNPHLDIRDLLEKTAAVGKYLDLHQLHKRVKKLRAVGATPNDILCNLEILRGYDIFNQKIELYKNSPLVGQGPFPVHLFLSKNLVIFKEQMFLGSEVEKVTKLLGVTVPQFQACWGFKGYNNSKLVYKVQMCLSAGILKEDIFNNLSVVKKFPIDECHAITSRFKDSGLPASVYALREIINAEKMNGHRKKNKNKNTVNDEKNDQKCAGVGNPGPADEDWMDEANTLCPELLQAPLEKSLALRNNELSSKKQKKLIFNLVEHQLQLDHALIKAVYKCHVSTRSVGISDIPKNLNYLLSLNFTKDQIATCPLILVHPHSNLVRVVKEAENLVHTQMRSALSPATPGSLGSSLGTSPSSSPKEWSNDNATILVDVLKKTIHGSPCRCLNTYQYLLEKENSFSLACADSERDPGYLNA